MPEAPPNPSATKGLSERLLAVFYANPGVVMTSREVFIDAGMPGTGSAEYRQRKATATISTQVARRSGPWSQIVKIGHGRYLYDPDGNHPRATAFSWTEITREGDLVVLRGPDGRLYSARPLSEQHPE